MWILRYTFASCRRSNNCCSKLYLGHYDIVQFYVCLVLYSAYGKYQILLETASYVHEANEKHGHTRHCPRNLQEWKVKTKTEWAYLHMYHSKLCKVVAIRFNFQDTNRI